MHPTSPTSAEGPSKPDQLLINNFDHNEDQFDSSEGYPTPLYSAGARVKNTIDYTKFKTRMCRHYLNGYQCPFEDRCAFSHGETLRARPPSFQEHQSAETSPVKGLPPPPPSYTALFGTDSPTDMDNGLNTPPAYPSRYRFEPYSVAGVVFES